MTRFEKQLLIVIGLCSVVCAVYGAMHSDVVLALGTGTAGFVFGVLVRS